MSLYDEIGGEAAISTALDHFYPKVLADPILKPYFEGVDMAQLKRKGQAFLGMAFGGPEEYDGDGLRVAHAGPRLKGMNEAAFDRFMFHFGATLVELGVPQDKVAKVAAVAMGAKADVLGQ